MNRKGSKTLSNTNKLRRQFFDCGIRRLTQILYLQKSASAAFASLAAPISADISQTCADVSQTLADVSQTLADVSQTCADVSQTSADISQTLADVSQTLADISQTCRELSLICGKSPLIYREPLLYHILLNPKRLLFMLLICVLFTTRAKPLTTANNNLITKHNYCITSV